MNSKCCAGVCCSHLWSCVCCGAGRCRVWARAAGLFTLTSSPAADLRTAHNSRAMSALRSDQSQCSSTNTPSHHALPAALLLYSSTIKQRFTHSRCWSARARDGAHLKHTRSAKGTDLLDDHTDFRLQMTYHAKGFDWLLRVIPSSDWLNIHLGCLPEVVDRKSLGKSRNDI